MEGELNTKFILSVCLSTKIFFGPELPNYKNYSLETSHINRTHYGEVHSTLFFNLLPFSYFQYEFFCPGHHFQTKNGINLKLHTLIEHFSPTPSSKLFTISQFSACQRTNLAQDSAGCQLLPPWQILDSSKLKEFAYDSFTFVENGRKFSKRLENTEGKGETARSWL